MTINEPIIRNPVSISGFSQDEASTVFEKVANQKSTTVIENNQPFATIMTPEEFENLSEVEVDMVLLEMTLDRVSSNEGEPAVPESEVLSKFGITQEDLDAIPESEIEFE